jgi:hypothetical protein
VPDNVEEETAEMRESSGSSLLGPGLLDTEASGLGLQPRRHRTTDVDELRANADQEDDGAREAFIESERRDEDGTH